MNAIALPAQVADELQFLASQVDLSHARVVELGCGNGAFGRRLIATFEGGHWTGVEVDERQHALNAGALPTPGLAFVAGRAEAIPLSDASADLVLMLKSLHHVPQPAMAQALREANRILRAGGHLYVSEPVFDGPFNEVVRLFNDEQVVRAHAQAALDAAAEEPMWHPSFDHTFMTPVAFVDFADFKRKLIDATYADHHLAPELLAQVRERFESHLTSDGARFLRPMRVRLFAKS